MLVNSRQSTKLLEQKVIQLQNSIKILVNTNKSVKDSNKRLLQINDTQLVMLRELEQSLSTMNLVQTELKKLKKENLKLKSYHGNKSASSSHEDTTEDNNSLLQKKIVDLEEQLLQNQTLIKQNSSLNSTQCAEKLSKLEIKNNELIFENEALKEQLNNLCTLHHQIMSEMQLKSPKYDTDDDQKVKKNRSRRNSPVIINLLDEDGLQPIQVHLIDSDAE